jgi:hypothetical protein
MSQSSACETKAHLSGGLSQTWIFNGENLAKHLLTHALTLSRSFQISVDTFAPTLD